MRGRLVLQIAAQDRFCPPDAQARIAELAAVTNNTGRARNVILFIGDGFSVAHRVRACARS